MGAIALAVVAFSLEGLRLFLNHCVRQVDIEQEEEGDDVGNWKSRDT